MADIRLMDDGEQAAFARSVSVPFLDADRADAEAHWSPLLEVGRTWLATDAGRVVGQCNTYTRTVTVPGPAGAACPTLPFTAVSGVGVHPTHRRRGILTAMMAGMLEDGRRRGEPLAGLLASQAPIYGRYGFGEAVVQCSTSVDPRHLAMRPGCDPGLPEVRLLDAAEAAEVLPGLHDRCHRDRAGDVDRTAAVWADTFADRPSGRRGMSGWYYAVADDAYAMYRGAEAAAGLPDRMSVFALYGADAGAEAAMWRWLTEIDLVERIDLPRRPLDEPLRWRLADPRRLATTEVGDMLWVRVLDTAAALGARAYPGTGRVVLDVVGDPDPAVGRWVLDAGPDGASCVGAGAGEGADLRLGLEELGALVMGGVAPSTLARAGRIDEEAPGALAVADRLFPTPRAPFCGTGF